jgi:hypothetical protein
MRCLHCQSAATTERDGQTGWGTAAFAVVLVSMGLTDGWECPLTACNLQRM